jgi:hypothetical protein
MVYYKRRPVQSVSWVLGSFPGYAVGCCVHFARSHVQLNFAGDSLLLLRSYLRGDCPLGVLVDRMEECPEEVSQDRKLVQAVVAHIRYQHSTLIHTCKPKTGSAEIG